MKLSDILLTMAQNTDIMCQSIATKRANMKHLFTAAEGNIMSKRQYLATILRLHKAGCLKADDIKHSAQNPTAYMTSTHIKLHYIALRKLGV